MLLDNEAQASSCLMGDDLKKAIVPELSSVSALHARKKLPCLGLDDEPVPFGHISVEETAQQRQSLCTHNLFSLRTEGVGVCG